MERVFIIFFLFLLFVGFVVLPIMIILALILGVKLRANLKAERQAYENMIASTNDTTVAEYIKIFQTTQNSFAGKLYNLAPGGNSIEDNMRISQGYTEVANSPNVSPELKEKLTMLLISKGIIIG